MQSNLFPVGFQFLSMLSMWRATLSISSTMPVYLLFLSTPSMWRATNCNLCRLNYQQISIHALREEGDQIIGRLDGKYEISIHALREEGDLAPLSGAGKTLLISIHALREEGDDYAKEVEAQLGNFYPRPPRGGRLGDVFR